MSRDGVASVLDSSTLFTPAWCRYAAEIGDVVVGRVTEVEQNSKV